MIYAPKSEVRPATILVDVQLQKTAAEEHGASLQELRQLVERLRWDIVGTLTQKLQSPMAASLIGTGKLNELSELVKAPSMAESVVFDHELTPTQVRNIREATGVEVYDRPAIILEIFHRHARTKEAQLQVELARLKYLAPRERVSGAKERRGGGRGARGVSASFLLHVVDAADPAFRSHIQVTKEVLEDIGAGKLPSLVILNKIDIVDSSRKALLQKEFPEAIAMSALNPQDVEALHSRLVTFFLDTMTDVELVVTYGKEV